MTELEDECYGCNKIFKESELEYGHESKLYCKECFMPTCSNCGELIDEGSGKYCSKECYVEEMYDLCEDDYKNR